jgi:hypothetical protein
MDGKQVSGEIKGSLEAIEFRCQDPTFLNLFPTGQFNTSEFNPQYASFTHLEAIDQATELMRSMLRGENTA